MPAVDMLGFRKRKRNDESALVQPTGAARPADIDPPNLGLWFTIDTEASVARQIDPDPATAVDQLIFGNWGNGEQRGIGLHMDLLEAVGYRGTFFVDVLLEYQFGQRDLERVVEAIEARGHEVELHVHPEHLAHSSDERVRSLAGNLLRKDREEFRKVMELAVDLFERRTGRRPVAYRAGGYRITEEHFPVLEEFGISIDASVNSELNSKVSDWMKARTQPFWVGGVLELPATWILIRDDRTAPGTRAFAPNLTTGDPVSVMPPSADGVPRIGTFVSHSFELMKADRDASPASLEDFRNRLRASLGPEEGDKMADAVGTNMRRYDGSVADDVVETVAEMLGRIAERPDARCVTSADLLNLTERFSGEEADEPTGPVPAIDRRNAVTGVASTRLYSADLRRRLSESGQILAPRVTARSDPPLEPGVPVQGLTVAVLESGSPAGGQADLTRAARVETVTVPPGHRGKFDLVIWPDGFERCPPTEIGSRLQAAADMLRPGGSLCIRVHTLGARPAEATVSGLADIVFPVPGDGNGNELDEVTFWDGRTFSSWFSGRGYEVLNEQRQPRDSAEVALVERFSNKLGVLADEELRTGAVDFTLRPSDRGDPMPKRGADEPPQGDMSKLIDHLASARPGDEMLVLTDSGASSRSLLERPPQPGSYDLIVMPWMFAQLGAERCQAACQVLYRALRPGGELFARLDEAATAPSATTVIACLLRAGCEIVEVDGANVRLVRPLEFEDIQQFHRNG